MKLNLTKKKILIGSSVLTITVLIIAGFYIAASMKKADKAKNTEQLPAVKESNLVSAEGTVVPAEKAELCFSQAGNVGEIYVKEGQQVKKGDLLVRLDNKDSSAQVEKAQASLEKTSKDSSETSVSQQSELKKTEKEYENTAKDLKRNQELYNQGAVSKQELEQAEEEYNNAEASYLKAKAAASNASQTADVSLAKATLEEAQAILAQTEIRAPFDGTVVYMDLVAGEYVQPGIPVVFMSGNSGWIIETDDLTEMDIARVKTGDAADIRVDGLPDLELKGTVIYASAFGEEKNGDMTYTVKVRPDKQDNSLRWNMTAYVDIKTEK